VIRVEWTPTRAGHQTQTIDVVTSVAGARTRLFLQAHVDAKVRFLPTSADFGPVAESEEQAMGIILTCQDPDVMVLEVRPVVPSVLLAAFVPASPDDPPGRLGILDVRLKPRNVRGPFGTQVEVKFRIRGKDGAPDHDYTKEVPVIAQIHGPVTVDPQGFYVSKVPPGGEIDYSVRLRRPDGAPFGIARSRVTLLPVDTVTLEQTAGEDRFGFYIDLTLAGPVGDYLGPLKGKVQFQTDIPGDRVTGLNIAGVVRN